MNKPAIPGVYLDQRTNSDTSLENPLRLDTRCITGFAGIAEQGEIHVPVHIRSFDEYRKRFGGFDTPGLLPVSVYNFFKCGGSECVVVRVAGEEQARKAALRVRCTAGYLTFRALSCGTWGNRVHARIWYEAEKLSPVTAFDDEGRWVEFGTAADPDPLALKLKGLKVRDVIRFSLGSRRFTRSVLAVRDRRVFLSRPLKLRALGACAAAGANAGADADVIASAEKLYFCVQLQEKQKIETFHHCSLNSDDERYLVRMLEKSALCRVEAENCSGVPDAFFSRYAEGGSDGLSDLRAEDFIGYYHGLDDHKGIGCFESSDHITLLCAPDMFSLRQNKGVMAVQQALVRQAERFHDRFAVLDLPQGLSAPEMRDWVDRIDSPNAAIYHPFINVIDPEDPLGIVSTPASASVCAVISSLDAGEGIFHAPANRSIAGAVGLAAAGDDEGYPAGINTFRYVPGKGVKLWGARTSSSKGEWRYINVRRTFTRICRALKQGSQWLVYEPNDRKLRKKLVRQVSGFLIDLWRRGFLAGSTAEQGFYVRCDDELNPPESVDRGLLCMEVGLAISRPVEFFVITISAEKEGSRVFLAE